MGAQVGPGRAGWGKHPGCTDPTEAWFSLKVTFDMEKIMWKRVVSCLNVIPLCMKVKARKLQETSFHWAYQAVPRSGVCSSRPCVGFTQKPLLIRQNTWKNSRWDFCRLYSVNAASAAKWSTVPGATSVSALWVGSFAHYFLANDAPLNFHLMTQLRVLTVDSGWFFARGGPHAGRKGVGVR